MKYIYIVSREDYDYDEYDSMVVVAENKESALLMHPNAMYQFDIERNVWVNSHNSKIADNWHGWTDNLKKLSIQYVGESVDAKLGVLHTSFRAG